MGYRVLTFDLYGWGGSASPKMQYGLDLYLEQIRELVPAVFGEREPFVLVGHSMGGWLAAHYQARYPKDVAALVLVAPAGLPVTTPFFNGHYSALIQAAYRLCSVGLLQPLISAVLRLFVYVLRLAKGPPMPVETLCAATALLEPFRRSAGEQYSKMMALSLESWRLQASRAGAPALSPAVRSVLLNVPFFSDRRLPALLEGIGRAGDPPVLLVWGKRDSFVPFANAGEALRLMGPRRVRFLAFCDADHFPFWDAPRPVARAIAALASDAGLRPAAPALARPVSCPCLCPRDPRAEGPAAPPREPGALPRPDAEGTPARPDAEGRQRPARRRPRRRGALRRRSRRAAERRSWRRCWRAPGEEAGPAEAEAAPACGPYGGCPNALAELDLASVEGYGRLSQPSALAGLVARAAPALAVAAGAAVLYRRRRQLARALSLLGFS
eukprot:tig00000663_g2966.t1